MQRGEVDDMGIKSVNVQSVMKAWRESLSEVELIPSPQKEGVQDV
jgi:peroxiredoxin